MSTIDPDSRYARIAELVDVDLLRRQRVTILGCGSMGGPIAAQLVRHGVGTVMPGCLRLVDGDEVEPRNLIGTEYCERHLGMPKAEALATILREINGRVNVSYWKQMLDVTHTERVLDMARQSDLLVLSADVFDLMLEISRRCKDICPIIMALFARRVDFAEVAFSLPGMTLPLNQTLNRPNRKSISQPSALGCDTTYVTSFVAALCLRLLLGETKGADLFPCDANVPLYLVGLRRTWIFQKQPDDVVRSIISVGTIQPPK